jgi:hypothetical protein
MSSNRNDGITIETKSRFFDNPNSIDSGIYSHKLQKQNPNWDTISYWMDQDPIQIWISWIMIS